MILFLLVFISTTLIGILIAKRYKQRESELKEIKTFLNILKTKIKFTYEPLGEILKDISGNFSSNVSNLLKNASRNMKSNSAKVAWEKAVEDSDLNILKEDKDLLANLGKLLGKTNLEGQVNQIEQTYELMEYQIKKAEIARIKNEKLYKRLGMLVGAGIVVLLI